MKLPNSVVIKETTKLYSNKYKFKLVLKCPVSFWFRGKNLEYAEQRLLDAKDLKSSLIKTTEDYKYCMNLLNMLKTFNQDLYDIRIENPNMHIYTNEEDIVETVSTLTRGGLTAVDYVFMPDSKKPLLEKNTIILKRLDYAYRIHIGSFKNRDHTSFLKWATDNKKIRLTKNCIAVLRLPSSWASGNYFYVKDDKALTMVKMFLGADISKIETVIKA